MSPFRARRKLGVSPLCSLLLATALLLTGCGLLQEQSLVDPSGLGGSGELLPASRSNDVLVLHVQETIRVAADGSGVLQGVLSTKSAALAALYQRYWREFAADQQIRDNLARQLQQEYAVFVGGTGAQVQLQPAPSGPGVQSFQFTGHLAEVARYDERAGLWYLWVRSGADGMEDAVINQVMTEFLIRGLLMNSLPGQQRFEVYRLTRIELPAGSRIVNSGELSGREWYLDLGSGNRLRAWAQVEGSVITVSEVVIQPENPPASMADGGEKAILERLGTYGAFSAVYSSEKGAVPSQSGRGGSAIQAPFDSFRWEQSVLNINASRSAEIGGLPRGCSVAVSASFNFGLTGFIGWRFSRAGLEWFDAHVRADSSLDVTPQITLSVPLRLARSKDGVWKFDKTFFFWVGWVPVWVTLQAVLDAAVDLNAAAAATFRAAAGVSMAGRAGALYVSRRWQPQFTFNPTYRSPSVVVTRGGEVSAGAGPAFTLGAYIYGLAGPYVRLRLILETGLRLSSRQWELAAMFKASGGVQTSEWLSNVVRLNLEYQFLELRQRLAGGSW